MKSYTQQELEEKYKQLPATIEEAIFSASAEKALEEIREKHNLQIDQLGILADETRLVMLGLTHPKNFINNLAERLNLDGETAKNIAQEINQRIFYKIREELKKIKWQDPPPIEPPPLIAEKPKIPTTPFEHKLKSEEIIRQPLEEIKDQPDKKYPEGDPYREPID